MTRTPFHSLDDFVALPRIEASALSPDGRRVVLTVSTLKKDGTSYARALWEVPADGGGTPRRLTRSARGEGGAVFTASGDLLFVSARPDADADDDTEAPQLWMLPASGGEARPITALAGGVSGVLAVADDAPVVIVSAEMLRSSESFEDDTKRRAERKKKKVSAILHDGYPVRFWDSDLGPSAPHLLAIDLSDVVDALPASTDAAADDDAADDAPAYPAHLPRPVDLIPHPGRSGNAAGVAITPDGATVIASLPQPGGIMHRWRMESIDVATGERTVLFDEDGVDYDGPVLSADGAVLAYERAAKSTPAGPTQHEIWISALDGTGARRIAEDWDRWKGETVFTPDGSALVVTADSDGRAPLFRIPLDDGPVEQLTTDDAAYTGPRIDRATGDIVALRSSWTRPPHPVRIAADGAVTELASPVATPTVPGSITEVETTAADGARVRGWLLLPEGADADAPAPLLLWVHGGPLNSWNGWSWRWNPNLAVARGYAVLLPDPALSTGYGLEFIARGWNSWGGAPYTDLMAITDAAIARPDVDETRTAAMGGSFGGYMANWIAGHTDRFDAVVTHASLWALDQFAGTTDMSGYWASIFSPEAMIENSPHRFVADIRSPMLVIHGDKDYRVPIGEGLRLWSELTEHFAEPDGSIVHRFLYFPDENHWILKPQHAVLWYETVFAFLAEHVLGEETSRPELLG